MAFRGSDSTAFRLGFARVLHRHLTADRLKVWDGFFQTPTGAKWRQTPGGFGGKSQKQQLKSKASTKPHILVDMDPHSPYLL